MKTKNTNWLMYWLQLFSKIIDKNKSIRDKYSFPVWKNFFTTRFAEKNK